jgi:hypothetical protein
MRWLALTLPLAAGVPACAQRSSARAPSWDTPIPAAEPRAQLRLQLDLEPVSDCDERFDLALYEERGVELLSWEEPGGPSHGCSERRLTVRYVPGRVSRDALLMRIRKISKKAEVVER